MADVVVVVAVVVVVSALQFINNYDCVDNCQILRALNYELIKLKSRKTPIFHFTFSNENGLPNAWRG